MLAVRALAAKHRAEDRGHLSPSMELQVDGYIFASPHNSGPFCFGMLIFHPSWSFKHKHPLYIQHDKLLYSPRFPVKERIIVLLCERVPRLKMWWVFKKEASHSCNRALEIIFLLLSELLLPTTSISLAILRV